MAQPTRRALLVSGATGKQGSALIAALSSSPQAKTNTPFAIYALTRDPSSRSARALAARHPHITLIRGDFSDPRAIFAQVPRGQLWGFFSVTNPLNAVKEEAQGKAMTAAAMEAGVRHVVFSATDRGSKGEEDGTSVPHFRSKWEIERDVVARCEARNQEIREQRRKKKEGKGGGEGEEGEDELTYTILRPVAFYENLTDDFLGRAFVTLWRLNGPSSRLQLVSAADVGKVAAHAFLSTHAPQFRNAAVPLAAEELSLEELETLFARVTGRALPATYGVVGRALRVALREQVGLMFDWFGREGFGVDVAEARARFPFLKGMQDWLGESSAWRK